MKGTVKRELPGALGGKEGAARQTKKERIAVANGRKRNVLGFEEGGVRGVERLRCLPVPFKEH